LQIRVSSVVTGLSSRIFQYARLRGDHVSRADRREEPPVDPQEHASRPGQILRDQRVQQAGRHAALHDDAAEPAAAGEVPE
jgi:hypothetical protein